MKLLKHIILMLFLFTSLNIVLADNGVWHFAEDIKPGTFGQDEGLAGSYIFENPVEVKNQLLIYKGVGTLKIEGINAKDFAITNQNSGGNIILSTSGNVGIGTSSPTAKLEITGKIKTQATVDTDSSNTVTTKSYVDSKIASSARLKTKDFYCEGGGEWYIKDGEFFCGKPYPNQIIEGSWTGMSGDCNPDTSSGSITVNCPSGYVAVGITEIQREQKYRSGNSWSQNTGWVTNDNNWNARTSISCSSSSCLYSTKGVTSLGWSNPSCSGNQYYSRMKAKVLCKRNLAKVNY